MSDKVTGLGRSTATVSDRLRKAIVAGQYPAGRFLPPARELGDAFGVSFETARRSLKVLEQEGLLRAHPRHGFRVESAVANPTTHCPIAYVTSYNPALSDAQPVNWTINAAIQRAASQRDWSALGAHGKNVAQLREQLEMARVWGIVLDSLETEFVADVLKLGLPTVMVNAWIEGLDVDVVLQDNYLGGFLAAKHLVESGAKRIAWINPIGRYCHSRERYAGAVAGLAACGQKFIPELVIDTDEDVLNEQSAATIRALFKKSDRPDAAMIFWTDIYRDVTKLLHELGIGVGRDLKVVSWMVEELFVSGHQGLFQPNSVPPSITWKAKSMMDAAMEILEMRRNEGTQEKRRLLVPTRLTISGAASR